MPVLRVHAARFHERRIFSAANCGLVALALTELHISKVALTSISLGLQVRLGSYSSDFGFLTSSGEQSSSKWEIPCPGRR